MHSCWKLLQREDPLSAESLEVAEAGRVPRSIVTAGSQLEVEGALVAGGSCRRSWSGWRVLFAKSWGSLRLAARS